MIENLLSTIALLIMMLGTILIIIDAIIGGSSGHVVVWGTLKFSKIGAVLIVLGLILLAVSQCI